MFIPLHASPRSINDMPKLRA